MFFSWFAEVKLLQHTSHKQETHLFNQLPRAFEKRPTGGCTVKVYICCRCSGLLTLPLTLSNVSGGRFSPGRWTAGVTERGDQVAGWCALFCNAWAPSLLAAGARRPQTSTCSLTCWVSMVNYLFSGSEVFLNTGCQLRFQRTGLCQVDYDNTSGSVNNFDNLVFIQQNNPVVSLYIPRFLIP